VRHSDGTIIRHGPRWHRRHRRGLVPRGHRRLRRAHRCDRHRARGSASQRRSRLARCSRRHRCTHTHTHFATTLGGEATADDYEGGSCAAAAGGVTTFVNFAFQDPARGLLEALDREESRAAGSSHVDYSFHVVVTDPVGGRASANCPIWRRAGHQAETLHPVGFELTGASCSGCSTPRLPQACSPSASDLAITCAYQLSPSNGGRDRSGNRRRTAGHQQGHARRVRA
jgi:hypothetical protein